MSRMPLFRIAEYECADYQAYALLEMRILTNSGCAKTRHLYMSLSWWSGWSRNPLRPAGSLAARIRGTK
jgi:hypothetical protein